MTQKPLFLLSLGFVSGCLSFLSYPGFDLWIFSFVGLVPLLFAIRRVDRWTHALLLAFTFSVTGNFGGFHWLVDFFPRFAGLPTSLGVLLTFLLSIYQGGHLTVFAMLTWWLHRRGVPLVFAATASIGAAETLYPFIFPSYLGYSLHPALTLIQAVDLGGPILLSMLLVFVNASLSDAVERWGRWTHVLRAAAPAVVGLVLVTAYGTWRIHDTDQRAAASKKLKVGMVQANMGTIQKRKDPLEGHRRHLEQSVAMEATEKPDVIVWPESGYHRSIPRSVRNARANVMIVAGRNGGAIGPLNTPVLFGGLSREDGLWGRHYNTAFFLSERGQVLGRYDKTFLLAFGEYLPFEDVFPWLRELSPRSGRFTAGDSVEAMEWQGWSFATFICYEDILPLFVRNMVNENDPHVLVNLTNDAWFGDTQEPWIHMYMAKYRSVEHHKYMVRSTNSGVSAFVDPVGRLMDVSEVMKRDNLVEEVGMMKGRTAYASLGNWPGWLAIVSVLALFANVLYRKFKSGRS